MPLTIATDLFEAYLTEEFAVYAVETTADGQGGRTNSEVKQCDVVGRMSPRRPREVISGSPMNALGERVDLVWDHTLYLKHDAEVEAGNIVVDCDDVRFRVVDVVRPSVRYHHLEAHCSRGVQ